MLKLADLLVAGFIFLLFLSIYREKTTTAVRFWMIGWLCVVLHFAAVVLQPHTANSQAVQEGLALGTLVLCGVFFALSFPESHSSRRTAALIGCLLAIPWLLAMVFGSLPGEWYGPALAAAILSEFCILGVCFLLFQANQLRFLAAVLLLTGCAAWLATTTATRDTGTVVSVVLTLCFGFNAVLLSLQRRRWSAASLTVTVGSVAWGAVWVSASLLDHMAPHLIVSPEIWNLPKYFVAAGMVLSLLEGEIRSAQLASEEYRLLYASNPHPMWIYDPETLAFLDVNAAAVSCYGFTRDEFRRMVLLDVVDAGDDREAIAALRANQAQKLSGPWLHRRKDGSEFQVDIASQPVVHEGRRATFALMHDVTEPQRLHAQLIRQAHHDSLTDLPNRALFEQKVEDVFRTAQDSGQRAALFCIDLDRFKQINDTYGHGAGDECLREMAHRMKERLGDRGSLARTGGDEFMLTLGGLDKAEDAEQLAALLLEDLKPSVPLERGEVELIASIGIAIYPDDGEERAQLWRDADAAMYRAKRAGGAQWIRVSREISNAASEANEIARSLRRALKAGNFEVYYQPQMTAHGTLHSLEALVRSKDTLLSKTPPDRYIAIAEESGLIVPLGDLVLEEVCRQSREWMDEGFEPVLIAVNVSPLQLTRVNFSLNVASALERHRLSPSMLEFEVTESTVMPDRGDAPHQIAMLARMGIRFSVDDFGKGYSSLGRLHQLPVNSLKIDCSFTRRISERKGTYPTVRAIIALAHTFGMKVVAEGVETDEQLRMLRSLECDRFQGYFFSRPLPASEVQHQLPRADVSLQQEAVA